MVETNVGLGEAIAGGTGLSGAWDSPISRGLGMAQKNQFAQIEQEQKRQAALQKRAEDMAKFTSVSAAGWKDPKNARAFQEETKRDLAEMIELYNSNDKIGFANKQNEYLTKLSIAKRVDEDADRLNKLPDNVATKDLLFDAYNKNGVVGIVEMQEKYPFLRLTSRIDPESGAFLPNEVKKVNIGRVLSKEIDRNYGELAKDKKIASVGNSGLYTIDKTSPEYKATRENIINNILNSSEGDSMVYDKRFLKFYDDFLAKEGVPHSEALDSDLEDAKRMYLNQVYDLNEVTKVEKVGNKPSGRGGSSQYSDPSLWLNEKSAKRFQFSPNQDGSVSLNSFSPTSDASPAIKGNVVLGDGSIDKNVEEVEVINPTIKYLGNGVFQVSGSQKIDESRRKPITMRMNYEQARNTLGLTDKGLQFYFPSYKPAAKPATKKAEPAKGGKLKKVDNSLVEGANIR